MPRPTVRKYLLSPETAANLKNLFGGPGHAHRALGIGLQVPLSEFSAALALDPVKKECILFIEMAWADWRRAFLQHPDDGEPTDTVRADRTRGTYYASDAMSPDGQTWNGAACSFQLPVLALSQQRLNDFAADFPVQQIMGDVAAEEEMGRQR